MKREILFIVLMLVSIGVYGQVGGTKLQGKVYLKKGEVKEGKIWINDGRFRVAGIGIKSGKYMKEISIKPEEGKKENIGIDQINKIEFETPVKVKGSDKQTRIVIYKPIEVKGELMLAREIVSNKLYGVYKVVGVIVIDSDLEPSQNEVYYINIGGVYEKTTLGALKKDYNCTIEGKNKEEKIAQCLK